MSDALDLYRPVAPGARVRVKARGAYRGLRGYVLYQISPPTSDEALTGRCNYALDLGFSDAEGNPNACDFRRHAFEVVKVERPRRRRVRS